MVNELNQKLFKAFEDGFQNDQRWQILFTEDGCLIEDNADRVCPRPGDRFKHPLVDFYTDPQYSLFKNRHDEIFIPEDATVPAMNDFEILQVFEDVKQLDRFPCFARAGARKFYRLNPANVKVGILTAGGTAPGLNMVIDSITKRHYQLGTKYAEVSKVPRNVKVMGFVGGYLGLAKKEYKEIDYHDTDKHALDPCSFLKALRAEESDEMLDKLTQAVRDLELDILYTIGGGGTHSAAHGIAERLKNDNPRRLIVAGPKTMDNDLNYTDVTFGFRTTVDNAKEVIMRMHADAEALNRLAIIELFGAESGFVALHASYASGEVDYALIPEMMDEPQEELERCVNRIAERLDRNQHAVLVVAEGASRTLTGKTGHEAFEELVIQLEEGINKAAEELRQKDRPENKKKAGDPVLPDGYAIFTNEPRHQIRSTPPNTFDIDLCKYTGKLMVDTALAGFTDCSVNLWQNEYVLVPLATTTARLKKVNVASYYFLTMAERYLLP